MNKSGLFQPYGLSSLSADRSNVSYQDSYMVYKTDIPKKDLNAGSKEVKIAHIPSACTEWIIGFNSTGKDCIFMCLGSVTTYTEISIPYYEHYYGIRFDENGCYFNKGLKKVSPASLLGRVFSYSPEKGSSEAVLIDELKTANSFASAVKAINAFLNTDKQYYSVPDSTAPLLKSIVESDGNVTVIELATASGYSARHITRLFSDWFGFGPKDLCRYVRFQQVLSSLYDNSDMNIGELSKSLGYSDQAHLQREFKAFMHQTPKSYIANLKN